LSLITTPKLQHSAFKQLKTSKLYSFNHASTYFISIAADYSAEIEKAVGTEIYSPIFKAGLFIFVSGIVSSFIAAYIVSSSDSWNDLENEFEKGRQAQYIENDIAVNVLSSTEFEVETENEKVITKDVNINKSAENLQDLDI
jgi:hypothetical protein